MKILSWNVRGLGGIVKRPEVRKLLSKNNPSIICLQEMKMSVIDEALCLSLWGDVSHSYSFRPDEGGIKEFVNYVGHFNRGGLVVG